jgi:CelD/BcsL family acetyltransferase involved in cellulose biosynthesis
VANAIAAALQDGTPARVINLRPMRKGGSAIDHLAKALASRDRQTERLPDTVCPIAPLPATVEAFLEQRSRNYRKKIGEYERRCHRELAATFRVSATAEDVRRDMDALMRLHRERWGRESRAFQSREYLTFHRELALRLLERGWVRLFSLNMGERPIALLYCFAYGGRYYYYQAGWDPTLAKYRLGLVLMHRAMLHAIAEGATVFDFLRGEEPYKDRWAIDRVASERLISWPGPGVRAASGARELARRILGHGLRAASSALPVSKLLS